MMNEPFRLPDCNVAYDSLINDGHQSEIIDNLGLKICNTNSSLMFRESKIPRVCVDRCTDSELAIVSLTNIDLVVEFHWKIVMDFQISIYS